MRNSVPVVLIAAAVLCASLPLAAQDQPKRETYAVTVFGTAGVTAGKSVTGTVIVNGYSSDA
jgi:hypothetical protein